MNAVLSMFNFRGRLSRSEFWWRTVLVWTIFMTTNALFTPSFGVVTTWLLNPIAIWIMGALAIQRLHDRNFSGGWLLIVLLPVAGAAWLMWQLAFRKGVADSNHWGDDPLASHSDFLVVR